MAAPPRIAPNLHPAFGEALKIGKKKLMSGSSGRWSKEPNRSPAQWRNAWQLEHLTGKYVIADRPLNGVDRTQVSRRALGEVGSGDAGGLRG